MANLKTFTLTCPDPECGKTFDLQVDIDALLASGDLIECPNCFEEWEWDLDDTTGVLVLLSDEDETGDDEMALDGFDDDEEDDESDEEEDDEDEEDEDDDDEDDDE